MAAAATIEGLQPAVVEKKDRSKIRVLALMEAVSVAGPAKNLLEFASRARPEVELAIVTFQRGGGPAADFVRRARETGIETFVVDEAGRFDASVMNKIREIFTAYGPDILQTHNVKSHFLIRLLKLQQKAPWIAFNHGYTATNFKDQLYNQLDRWSLLGAYRMVTVCGPFARALEGKGVEPARIRV